MFSFCDLDENTSTRIILKLSFTMTEMGQASNHASLCMRSLGFSVKQAIMPVPVSLPDTRMRARNTLRQSLLSPPCVDFVFLISEEFVNNLIYISLMSGIHRNNL